MGTISVREAESTDRAVLWAFHQRLYVEHRDEVVPAEHLPLIGYRDYEQVLRDDLDATLRDSRRVVLVAEREGACVGYITGRVAVEPRRALPKRGIVEDWFVEPDARGSGVGRRLAQELEKRFAAAGCEVMESATWSDNRGARRAHDALGFHEIRVLYRKPL